ncbi:MAG: hypothetical protein ACYC4K_03880 [Thiobacillus sp.]
MKMTPLEAINLNVTALDFPADEQFKADIEAAKAALAERNKPKVDPYQHLRDALAAGKRIRLILPDGGYTAYLRDDIRSWGLTQPADRYEIEPDTKRIDWSKMPDDVLVTADGSRCYLVGGMLSAYPKIIADERYPIDGREIKLAQSQPWVVWFGGECPVPDGVVFDFVDRDGDIERSGLGSDYRWDHRESPGDIIAYRITGIADGWTE